MRFEYYEALVEYDASNLEGNAIYEQIQTLKDLTVEDLDVYQKFKNQFDQRLKFTTPYDPNEGPIITLTESVSSWNVGDQIVIGRISNFKRIEAILLVIFLGLMTVKS